MRPRSSSRLQPKLWNLYSTAEANTSPILSDSNCTLQRAKTSVIIFPTKAFFIDMSGRYLGEVVHGNRLMFNRASPRRSTNFGAYGNYGNAGNDGNPGNHGSIGTVGGYDDIEADWLR